MTLELSRQHQWRLPILINWINHRTREQGTGLGKIHRILSTVSSCVKSSLFLLSVYFAWCILALYK